MSTPTCETKSTENVAKEEGGCQILSDCPAEAPCEPCLCSEKRKILQNFANTSKAQKHEIDHCKEPRLQLDFEQNLKLINPLLATFNMRDKSIVSEWICKFKDPSYNEKEKILRNDLLRFLIERLKCGNLNVEPFKDIPPPGPLSNHADLLPESLRTRCCDTTCTLTDKCPILASMLTESPDNGEFLLSMPVPKEGVFCYKIIVPYNVYAKQQLEKMQENKYSCKVENPCAEKDEAKKEAKNEAKKEPNLEARSCCNCKQAMD